MKARHPLEELIEVLDEVGVEHMLTGSFASSFHGVPRATQDIDLVIDPGPEQLRQLVLELQGRDYYVNLEAAEEALRLRGQFNALDRATGWKIDLIIRKDRDFSRLEFSRRVEQTPLGFPVDVATAEDTLLAKLEWAQRGGSELQIRDAVGILRAKGASLDREYVDRWAQALGVKQEWEAVRALQEDLDGRR